MSARVDGRKTSGGVAAMIERFESIRDAKSSRARGRIADDGGNDGAATGGRAGRVSLLIERFGGRSTQNSAPAAPVVPPERPNGGVDDATAAIARGARPESETGPEPGTCSATTTAADPAGTATTMRQGSETDVQTHVITSLGPQTASGDNNVCWKGRPRRNGGSVVDGRPAVARGPVVYGGRAAAPLADCWAPSALMVEPGLSSRRSEADRRRRRVMFVAEAQTLSADGRLGHELVDWEPRPGRPWIRGGEWVGDGAERDSAAGQRNFGGGGSGGRRGGSRDGQSRRRSRGSRRSRGREA